MGTTKKLLLFFTPLLISFVANDVFSKSENPFFGVLKPTLKILFLYEKIFPENVENVRNERFC